MRSRARPHRHQSSEFISEKFMTGKKMRSVQVVSAGGAFELVEREVREPGKREVRVKVQACGLCNSDALTKEGHWPGIVYPRVPGHEIAGLIDAVGEDVPPL